MDFRNFKHRTGVLIAAALAAAALIVFLFIRAQRFDVWDYITISYEGASGYATPVFTVDKDKLYEELMGKSSDSDKVYNVKMLIASIDISTDATDLSNGDKYKVNLTFDEKYENGAGVSLGGGSKKIKASGISKGTEVDIFEYVDVKFVGISPEAGISIVNGWEEDYLAELTFSADKSENISRDDTITITCDQAYEDIARHGYIANETQISLAADQLPDYVSDVLQIDSKLLETVKQEAKEVVDKETQDATFHMLYKATGDTTYLYHVNSETCSDIQVSNVYFLKKNSSGGDANNYIYIMVSAVVSDAEASQTVYFAFCYSNNYVNVDGTFDMNHDDAQNKYTCGTDYSSLYDECIAAKTANYTVSEVK